MTLLPSQHLAWRLGRSKSGPEGVPPHSEWENEKVAGLLAVILCHPWSALETERTILVPLGAVGFNSWAAQIRALWPLQATKQLIFHKMW
jgi:hypothetical protein